MTKMYEIGAYEILRRHKISEKQAIELASNYDKKSKLELLEFCDGIISKDHEDQYKNSLIAVSGIISVNLYYSFIVSNPLPAILGVICAKIVKDTLDYRTVTNTKPIIMQVSNLANSVNEKDFNTILQSDKAKEELSSNKCNISELEFKSLLIAERMVGEDNMHLDIAGDVQTND